MDASKCNIDVCDLVTISKALSDNYRLDIDCAHVELCGFGEYYFSEKKKCIPGPPVVLGQCQRRIEFFDHVCSVIEQGQKLIISFKDYVCSVLNTAFSYIIKADDFVCQIIEVTTTTTTELPITTVEATTTTSTTVLSTTTTSTTVSTTTTTEKQETIQIAFESYVCQLTETEEVTTTTTTLVDWKTTLPVPTTTIPTTVINTTTSTTVDPSLPTTTADPNLPTTTQTPDLTTTVTPCTGYNFNMTLYDCDNCYQSGGGSFNNSEMLTVGKFYYLERIGFKMRIESYTGCVYVSSDSIPDSSKKDTCEEVICSPATNTTTIYPVTTTTTTVVNPDLTTTTTTTVAPCSITVNVISDFSVMPEFNLINSSVVYNAENDWYELILEYTLWAAASFGDCQPITIEFDVYKQDGTHITTITRVFNSDIPNIWEKPVTPITDTFIFFPFLFSLGVNGGTGSGQYKEFSEVEIVADVAPSEYVFTGWTGDIEHLDNPSTAQTIVTMPDSNMQITSNYLFETGIKITWDNIANVPVDDAYSVNDWNVFFNPLDFKNTFTSVDIVGNVVYLKGVSDIVLNANFKLNTHILRFEDLTGCITTGSYGSFEYCSNLEFVSLDAMVTAGPRLFYSCAKLTAVSFNSLVVAESQCFTGCSSLSNTLFPVLEEAHFYAFVACTSLVSSFPSLKTTGNNAFYYCTSMTDSSLFPLLETLGDTGFNRCNFINPSFPSLISIGYDSFTGNTNLTNPSFPVLESIGNNAFAGCANLVISEFPSALTIGELAFINCTSLLNPSFPLVTSIGYNCFASCTSMQLPSFPSVVTMNGNVFYNCSSIIAINMPLLTVMGWHCFNGCTSLVNINMPLLQSIGNFCFRNCTSLVSAQFPLLATIAQGAFMSCTALEEINIPSCTTISATVGNDIVFSGITGKTITLTIPSALMTCNAGQPDGDIQQLIDNNTVTVITV